MDGITVNKLLMILSFSTLIFGMGLEIPKIPETTLEQDYKEMDAQLVKILDRIDVPDEKLINEFIKATDVYKSGNYFPVNKLFTEVKKASKSFKNLANKIARKLPQEKENLTKVDYNYLQALADSENLCDAIKDFPYKALSRGEGGGVKLAEALVNDQEVLNEYLPNPLPSEEFNDWFFGDAASEVCGNLENGKKILKDALKGVSEPLAQEEFLSEKSASRSGSSFYSNYSEEAEEMARLEEEFNNQITESLFQEEFAPKKWRRGFTDTEVMGFDDDEMAEAASTLMQEFNPGGGPIRKTRNKPKTNPY